MAIRKVNGAKPVAIIILMTGEVIKLVLMAVLFACPVSYLVINKWLENFAYRIETGPAVFILSLLITLSISFAIISYHIIKVSRVNPAEIIRYE